MMGSELNIHSTTLLMRDLRYLEVDLGCGHLLTREIMPGDVTFVDENTVANRLKIYGFDNYQAIYMLTTYLYLFLIIMIPLVIVWMIL